MAGKFRGIQFSQLTSWHLSLYVFKFQLLFSGDDKSVVYPCHSIVVDMDITSGKQRFFIGHTDKVHVHVLVYVYTYG